MRTLKSENGDQSYRRIAVRIFPDEKGGLSAIQLRRQVARDLHAGLRLLDRRLVPLTHIRLSFREFKAKLGRVRPMDFANPNFGRPALPIWFPGMIISKRISL